MVVKRVPVLKQMAILLKKNTLLYLRSPSTIFMEVFLPIYVVFWLWAIKFNFDPNLVKIPAIPASDSQNMIDCSSVVRFISYYPKNDATQRLVTEIEKNIPTNEGTLIGFKSYDAMYSYYEKNPSQLFAALDLSGYSEENPQFALRYNYTTNYGIFTKNDASATQLNYNQIPFQKEYIFFLNGISSLEEIIFRSIYNLKSSTKLQSSLIQSSSRFGFPSSESVVNIQQYILPMLFLSFTHGTLQCTTRLVGSEKERGIKEMLSMNGMSGLLYWFSWLLFEIIWQVVPASILILGCYIAKVVKYTDYGLFWVLSYLVSLETLTFSFVISAIINKTNSIIYISMGLATVFPAFYYLIEYAMIAYDVHRVVVGIFFLLPLTPYTIFIHDLTEAEAYQRGLGWDKLNLYSDYLQDAVIVMSLCVVLYMVLALYLTKVVQQNVETPLPFYFFLMPSYYQKRIHAKHVSKDETNSIVVDNIHKTYNKGKKNEFKAVKGVNLKIKRNEIFALLGHNGAGKTTLLNMIIGLLTPNEGEGDIIVNGNSVTTSKEEVRKSLGVCPQFDVLYDELTPMDHILLYGGMKGLKENELREQGKRLLETVGLTFKTNESVYTFSGGQKRRLSLILSLIGNPEIVVLDEPTTGLDPYNRRKVWNLLEEEKKDKTIILTTHSMEEADALGDEIAVMSEGLIQAQGTSLELKMKYGKGYHMNIKKNENCEVEKLNEAIKEIIEYKKMNDNGSELKYILPLEDSSKLSSLFKKLEEKKEELHYGSISMTMPSLEDVFVELAKIQKQVSNSNSDDKKPPSDGKASRKVTPTEDEVIPIQEIKKQQSVSRSRIQLPQYKVKFSLWNQFKGMCYLLYKYQIRSQFATAFMLVYPILFTTALCIIDLVALRDINEYKFEVSKYPHHYSNKVLVPYVDSVKVKEIVNTISGQFPNNYEFIAVNTEVMKDIKNDTIVTNPNYDNKVIPFCIEPKDTDGVNIVLNGNINYNSRSVTYLLYNSYYRKESNGKEITAKHMRMKDPTDSSANALSFANGGAMILVAAVFASISASFCENIVFEKTTNIKNQFLISSLNRKIYWLAHATIHTVFCFVPFIICIVLMACFQFKGVLENNFFAFILILILYSPLSVTFGYLIALPMNSLIVAQESTNELINMMTMLPWLFTAFSSNPSRLVMNLCAILPPYGVFRAFSLLEGAAKTGHPYSFKDIFDPDRDLIYVYIIFIVELILFSSIIYLVEIFLPSWNSRAEKKKAAKYYKSRKVDLEKGVDEKGDANVEQEVNRIKEKGNTKSDYDLIHIKEMSKIFKKSDGKYFQAVNKLSLGINTGELFGLLGENGAGKTTLIKILTGVEVASEGEGYINQYSITNELEKARTSLGVCPQFDALYNNITPYEYLYGYCLLYSIEKNEAKNLITSYLDSVNLTEKKDCLISSLSGGNKRRMSVLLSLIGNPKVVFLDEPSTGMDPITRRGLWNFIEDIRENGKVIVLTTHSMEEAETLCNRIGILTHGNMRCLGTSADLKRDYGNGYFLTVRLNKNVSNLEENQKEVEKMIQALYPKSMLTSQSSSIIRIYHITEGNIQFSKIFEELENNKEKLSIDEYSILETTLDDVFLFFADEGKKDPDEI